ncbi:MAG TPA: hypothetical protein VLG10_07675 [Methylomirabilota bacterium]|nr:hypothetical protein [Methylomirabilota bacterium]
MPLLKDGLTYLREHRLRPTLRKVVRTYVVSRQRLLVVHIDMVENTKRPLHMDGCEVRRASPDDPLAGAFPHLTPSTLRKWLRADHFFYVLVRGGSLAGYRCLSMKAPPSVRGFFKLRSHQLFVVDHFIRPELRRLGLSRIMQFAMAHDVVARGFSEAFAVVTPTNYDEILSGPRRGVMRIGTLVRTCRLGRVRFALTPVMALSSELILRQLAVLKQAVPQVAHAGVLFNPTAVAPPTETQEGATGGITLLPVRDAVDQVRKLDEAFVAGRDAGIQGLIVLSDPMMKEYRRVIVRLVERLHIPAIYDAREFVAAGGLMSYGAPPPCFADIESTMAYRDAGKTVDHPSPDARAPRLDVNRKGAAALGLTLPFASNGTVAC